MKKKNIRSGGVTYSRNLGKAPDMTNSDDGRGFEDIIWIKSLFKAMSGGSCGAHDDCSGETPFCYQGVCSACDECHYCSDGIDGTCGTCGEGYPTRESGDCSGSGKEHSSSLFPRPFHVCILHFANRLAWVMPTNGTNFSILRTF